MPLAVKWSSFTKDDVARHGDQYGVYELGDFDDIFYIGEGLLNRQLMSHFSTGGAPTPGVSSYRVETTQSKERAVQRQNAELRDYERRHGRLPKYNQKSRA